MPRFDRLTGATAIEALLDYLLVSRNPGYGEIEALQWLAKINRVHTGHGIVYYSEIEAALERLRTLEPTAAKAGRRVVVL